MATDFSDKYEPVEIVERRDYGPDLWSIRVAHDLPFEFRAGQYATLGVEVNGKPLERPYSIVSSPEEKELEFFIELIPDGALTPYLYPLQVGDRMLMRKRPKGVFLKGGLAPARTHLFMATVTGIAPFASILRLLRSVDTSIPPASADRQDTGYTLLRLKSAAPLQASSWDNPRPRPKTLLLVVGGVK